MPPSDRITFRLTPQLQACVAERVRQGGHLSDIAREALELYFGLRPTQCPTPDAALSDSISQVSDDLSDKVSDTAARLSDVLSDVSDMQARLVVLETILAERASGVGQRQTERPTPPPMSATPEPPGEALPPHIQRIAETAAQYERLSLAELAQLLFDRGIYRAKDRKTGEEKPVNRGTLQKWLEQARQGGAL